MRHSVVALLLLLGQIAAAADDPFRVIKLEQDMRNLERQVQGLSRQVEELKQQLTRAGERSTAPARSSARPAAASSTAWLDAANWERLRVGMTELEMISLLGPPSSMRQEGEERILLYAMEIGSSGFLSGSVGLQDRAVVHVSRPVLK